MKMMLSFVLHISVMMVMLVGMFLLSLFFIESYQFNANHDSIFECGFEPFFLNRVPFSIPFFQMTIVFLIFDVEVVMFLPNMTNSWLVNYTHIMSMMVLMVLIGLIIEWYDNSLEWSSF